MKAQLIDLRDRILSLLPAGTTPTRERWNFPRPALADVLTLSFDPICAGNIERSWPAIYSLCEDCGCLATLICKDTVANIAVLDTRSGAPNYHTETGLEVSLVLSKQQEARRAA